jgi:UDP-glucose 4-epimerase
VAHAERVRTALGWRPRFDDLEAIVRTQLDWERRLLREPALQRN